MSDEGKFIKEALDAGLYKHTTRITSSILLQTSDIVHRNMAIQATLKDNLGKVFYSLNEGLKICRIEIEDSKIYDEPYFT